MNYRDLYQSIVQEMRQHGREHPLNRRTFVFGGAAIATGVTVPSAQGKTPSSTPAVAPGSSPQASPVAFSDNPFTLGVASGEPLPDGVVLWTRLAPKPLAPGSGMPDVPVTVQWEVATDEAMSSVVQRGVAMASPAWGHSVHVEVEGLSADHWYWYRFMVGNEVSPIGRTRTAPAAGTPTDAFRFAFASCQRWDQGLFTAYRDMAAQAPDLIVHLGDYIYESRINTVTFRDTPMPIHATFEPRDLESYRTRYALYKLDPHLQEAHRIAPWMVTWDDHEVSNNYFGAILRDLPVSRPLLARRAAAYQAYYENQPLRKESIPNGPDLQLYRRRAFGDLIEFNVLDTRQYRSAQGQLCDDATRKANGGFCPDSLDPSRTLLGAPQKQWLFDGLQQTSTRWNVLAQQVPIARIDNDADPEIESFGGREMDKWDGYAWERDQVITELASNAKAKGFHPVVLTGDVHASYVWDLKTDWDDPSAKTVFGTEFVGTSIASNGDTPLKNDGGFTTECGNRNGNPHNHLFDNHRGYVICDVDRDIWQSTYRVLPTVEDDDAAATTLTSFAVEHAHPGAQLAGECVNHAP